MVVIATKFGISFENLDAPGTHAVITDSRPETIRRSVEGSLRRLQTRYYTENDRFDAATDYRASMPQFQKESFGQNRELFSLLDTLAERKHATPAQISLAWMMCRKPWIVPIPGTRRLCRLKNCKEQEITTALTSASGCPACHPCGLSGRTLKSRICHR